MGHRSVRALAVLATCALVAGLGAASTAPAAAAGKRVTSGCASVVIMGARGSGEDRTSGSILDFGKRADRVATEIAARLPSGTTYKYLGTNYPAKDLPGWDVTPSKAKEYMASMLEGAARVESDVRSTVSSCPSSKIVLVGYSQGAFAVHYALWRLGDKPEFAKAVRSVILLADPLNQGATVRQRLVNVAGVGRNATEDKNRTGIIYRAPEAMKWLGKLPQSKLTGTVTAKVLDGVTSPILVDHTRTMSVCNPTDAFCSRGTSTADHSNSYHPNAANKFKNAVAADTAAFAVAALSAKNSNGVCDPGEFCAFDDAAYKTVIMDWSANAARTSIDIFNISVANNKAASVWNRTPYTWTGVDEKVTSPDRKIAIGAGAKVNLAKTDYWADGPFHKWADKIDHFDVQKY